MSDLLTPIRVGLEGSTANNCLPFYLNNQNALSMSELSESFPGIIGLKYRNARTGEWELVLNKDADGNLIPADWDTWHFDIVYVPHFTINPAASIPQPTVPSEQPTVCTTEKDVECQISTKKKQNEFVHN